MNKKVIKQFDKFVQMLGYNRLRSDNMINNDLIIEDIMPILEKWNGTETQIQDLFEIDIID